MTFTDKQQVICKFFTAHAHKIFEIVTIEFSIVNLLYKPFTRQCITDRKLNFDTDYKSGQPGLQNGAAFRDYQSGQKGLQIGAGSEITKRGKRITNRGRNCKSGQELQIGVEQISYYKSIYHI